MSAIDVAARLLPRVLMGLSLASAAVLAPSALLGCSGAPEVAVVSAADLDLSQYRSYRWITDEPILIHPGAGDPAIRTVAHERAIRAAIDRALTAAGLVEVDGSGDGSGDGTADLIVDFSLETKLRYQVQGGSTPLVMVADDPATVTRGALTVRLFAAEQLEQVWSATAQSTFDRDRDPTDILAAEVAAILAELPRAQASARE